VGLGKRRGIGKEGGGWVGLQVEIRDLDLLGENMFVRVLKCLVGYYLGCSTTAWLGEGCRGGELGLKGLNGYSWVGRKAGKPTHAHSFRSLVLG
jgi:hypothetical protein